MVQIYTQENIDYENNGNITLSPSSCIVEAKINDSWVLKLEHPIDEYGKWKSIIENNVIKVSTWQEEEQLYRISEVEKKYNIITAIAYPIFLDSANEIYVKDTRIVLKGCNEALQTLLINTEYKAPKLIFTDYNSSERSFIVKLINVEESSGDSVLFPAWTIHPSQQDIKWLTTTKKREKDGSLSYYRKIYLKDFTKSTFYIHAYYVKDNKKTFVIARNNWDSKTHKLDDITYRKTNYKMYSDITDLNTAYFINKNLVECLMNSENGIITRWGGEIEYNNYQCKILKRIGKNNNVVLKDGININEILYKINTDNIATRLIPRAFNGRMMLGDEPYVESPLVGYYPIIYTKIKEFPNYKYIQDADTDDDSEKFDTLKALSDKLKAECEKLFSESSNVGEVDKIDTPDITIDFNVVNLDKNKYYAKYKDFYKIGLGDNVLIQHARLNLDIKARVTEITWNCISNKADKITIGKQNTNYIQLLKDSLKNSEQVKTSDSKDLKNYVYHDENGTHITTDSQKVFRIFDE